MLYCLVLQAKIMPLDENLTRDHVADLTAAQAVTVPPSATIREAIERMQSAHAGCLFVAEGDRLVGVFTERDVLKRVLGKGAACDATIQQVLTSSPTTVTPDQSIRDALRKMIDGGYRHLPVVDKRGRILGRVTVREIVHYMVEHFPKAVYNLPPRPDQVPATPDGA